MNILVIPEFRTDKLVSFLHLIVITPRYGMNIALFREMEDTGVYTAYAAETE